MTNLLCLLLGCLLPVLALGLMVRRGFRPVAAAAVYRNLAWKLQLDVDMRGRGIRGELDGRGLFVGLTDPARSTGPVTAVLELQMPLGVGLRVRPRGMANRIRRRAPGSVRADLSLGDPELDSLFEVTALEPEAAAGLWTDAVRDALSALRAEWRDIVIGDSAIRVTSPTPITVEKRLLSLIHGLRRLADALHAARDQAQLPAALAEAVPSWAGLAEAHGLTLLPHRPAVTGQLAGRAFQATCGRDDTGFSTTARIAWRDHRPTGLTIRAQQATDSPGAAGQDIAMGDAAFDDALVVKGYDPGSIRAMLRGGAQEALTALARTGEITMTDRSLTLSRLPTDASSLHEVARLLTTLGDALGW